MDRLIKEMDAMLAVQNAIMELGYDPLGKRQNKIYEAIEKVPTAYDVDKVVAEIGICSGNGYRDVDGDYVPPMIRTKEAIDIVRKGGVE